MNSIDIEKNNRETFKALLDTLSMPGNIVKVNKLFDSFVLGIASVLLYSEVSYLNTTNEDFTVIDAITNAKKEGKNNADYIFCNSLEDLFGEAKKGTYLSPENSATIVYLTDSFKGTTVVLKGPGIDGSSVGEYPVSEDFIEKFNKNNADYPLGNEIYFLNKTSGELKALSRTTQLEVA